MGSSGQVARSTSRIVTYLLLQDKMTEHGGTLAVVGPEWPARRNVTLVGCDIPPLTPKPSHCIVSYTEHSQSSDNFPLERGLFLLNTQHVLPILALLFAPHLGRPLLDTTPCSVNSLSTCQISIKPAVNICRPPQHLPHYLEPQVLT